MNYYIGKYEEDAPAHRGWVVGTFMEDEPRKTEVVEVKYWRSKAGDTSHPAKESAIIECTFILSGKCEALIENHKVILQAGDYVVIKPGIRNNLLQNVLETAAGITIKAPSDPNAKKILENV